jgi:hypothetical protein
MSGRRDSYGLLRRAVFGRIPRVRGLHRPATHARGAATLRLRDPQDPFVGVYSPVSSCMANVIGLPSFDCAFDVTVSTRPSFGQADEPLADAHQVTQRPARIIVCNGAYTLSV